MNIYSAFTEEGRSEVERHMKHLADFGMLVLRSGQEGETNLVMVGHHHMVEVRYPSPHNPQHITPIEAEGLLQYYRGEITQYS